MFRRYLKKLKKRIRQRINKAKLKRIINSQIDDLKIIIGAGSTQYQSWIPTNILQFNILKERDWNYYFSKNKPTRILSEHVLEHLTFEENKVALSLSFKYLDKGGKLRIAVPDAYHKDLDYLNAVKPGGWDAGADDHKIFWNYILLKELGETIGFKVDLKEYYDENGIFHFNEYSNKDGYIKRSNKNNYVDRNILNYSSLVVDFIKV